jgi:hypothetical protein
MSDFLVELMHSWGTKPEQKAAERKYNAEYYQEHKDRWQKAYESMKRQERKEENSTKYAKELKAAKKYEQGLLDQESANEALTKKTAGKNFRKNVKNLDQEIDLAREWREDLESRKEERMHSDRLQKDIDEHFKKTEALAKQYQKLNRYDDKDPRKVDTKAHNADEAKQRSALNATREQLSKEYEQLQKRQRNERISRGQAENQRSQAMQNALNQATKSDKLSDTRYKHIAKVTAANIKNSESTKAGAREVERWMKYQSK